MRISDWSSDVCSSDLPRRGCRRGARRASCPGDRSAHRGSQRLRTAGAAAYGVGDRKSVVSGKSVSVRVDLGGHRTIKKNNKSKPYKKLKQQEKRGHVKQTAHQQNNQKHTKQKE